MFIHVLLYEAGKENEGIHSLELKGKTVILMFEDIDDAERYCGLLEAQDFPKPTIEKLERNDLEKFCIESGYDAKFVKKGFIPSTDEERLLISPPESNLDVSSWTEEDTNSSNQNEIYNKEKLEDIKNRLEGLI